MPMRPRHPRRGRHPKNLADLVKAVISEHAREKPIELSKRKRSGTIGMKPAARETGICRAWEALDETGRVADIATLRTAF